MKGLSQQRRNGYSVALYFVEHREQSTLASHEAIQNPVTRYTNISFCTTNLVINRAKIKTMNLNEFTYSLEIRMIDDRTIPPSLTFFINRHRERVI